MITDYVVAGVIFGWWTLVVLGIGVAIGKRVRRTAAPPRPICGCGHHRALHDPDTGKCHNTRGYICRCQQYVGPEPVESFYVTPTLPPSEG